MNRLAALCFALLVAGFVAWLPAPPPAGTASTPPPIPVPAHCHAQGPLPDPACTPGAADPRVTDATIKTTICVPGYATRVRPPKSYTEALKRRQLKQYGLKGPLAAYEEDHLIGLEDGGSPTDPRNLWPESFLPLPGARQKDALENEVHKAICAGAITLAGGQQIILNDWVAGYDRYILGWK